MKWKKKIVLLKSLLKTVGKWLLIFHVVFLGVIFFLLLFVRFFNPPVTSIMLYRQWISGHRVYPLSHVRLRRIPSEIRTMVVSLEDDRFYYHHGFDLRAIQLAFERNMEIGRTRYGGSTITQQLARTLFLWPGRSYVRKYLEILIAIMMDFMLPKNRILELYLNTAEWGRGIFGIQQGSFFHYNAPLDMLTLDQQIRLLVILASPVRYSPYDFGNLRILHRRYRHLVSTFGE